MTAKEYLRQLWDIDKEINIKMTEIEELQERATRCAAPEMTGMPRGGSGKDAISDVVIKIVDMQCYINHQTDRLIDLRMKITKQIDRMKNYDEKRILRRRYILHEKWEKISEEESWTVQNCHRIHRRALIHFEQKYKKELNKMR